MHIGGHDLAPHVPRYVEHVVGFLPDRTEHSVAAVYAFTDVVPAVAAIVPETIDGSRVHPHPEVERNGQALGCDELFNEPGQIRGEKRRFDATLKDEDVTIPDAKLRFHLTRQISCKSVVPVSLFLHDV